MNLGKNISLKLVDVWGKLLDMFALERYSDDTIWNNISESIYAPVSNQLVTIRNSIHIVINNESRQKYLF